MGETFNDGFSNVTSRYWMPETPFPAAMRFWSNCWSRTAVSAKSPSAMRSKFPLIMGMRTLLRIPIRKPIFVVECGRDDKLLLPQNVVRKGRSCRRASPVTLTMRSSS